MICLEHRKHYSLGALNVLLNLSNHSGYCYGRAISKFKTWFERFTIKHNENNPWKFPQYDLLLFHSCISRTPTDFYQMAMPHPLKSTYVFPSITYQNGELHEQISTTDPSLIC